MEDNYSNELIEVDSTSFDKFNMGADENSLQLMQNFASTIIGLSQQIAENNAAKYKAQAEVMIADIQAKMQEECQEINGYYNLRERQEEHFGNIIASYQEQFNKLTDCLLTAENEVKIDFFKYSIEKLQSGVDIQLEKLAKNIRSEQNTRIENSKSRSKGLFGLFKRG